MKPISDADFGKTAEDYAKHRAGFPTSLFEQLAALGIGQGDQSIVDLGTGTGSLARGFALAGSQVIGVDPAADMLRAAVKLDTAAGVKINYVNTKAETTGLTGSQFDIVSAGQCWHWFDPQATGVEVRRLLRPDGRIVIAYYDWLPLTNNVVRRTEELIEAHNSAWKGGNGFGFHPEIFRHLSEAGFNNLKSFSYDEAACYTPAAWRGRIRASAGVSASLDSDQVARFDQALADCLKTDFPQYSEQQPMAVPHRVFVLHGEM